MPEFQTENLAQSNKDRVVIVGGGIVGAALANFLSERKTLQVVLIDRSISSLNGSTSHAPGLVGQLNKDLHLTRLAKASVKEYHKILDGFDSVGGLEIATSSAEVETLQDRLKIANKAGLRAKIITAEEAVALAPDFVRRDIAQAALHFLDDGIAKADTITTAYRDRATANGAMILNAAVKRIIFDPKKSIHGVETDQGPIISPRVVLATGIWTASFLKQIINLPIIPVAHPYLYGGSPLKSRSCPFVRYPSAKLYIRNDDHFVGMGSYDHQPLPVDSPSSSALEPWPQTSHFDDSLHRARSLFPDPSILDGGRRINGIFALTPDNLPLAGPVRTCPGLWVVAAVWVTHAAGTARVVAEMLARELELTGGPGASQGRNENENENAALESALNPERFVDQDTNELRASALSWYFGIGKYLS